MIEYEYKDNKRNDDETTLVILLLSSIPAYDFTIVIVQRSFFTVMSYTVFSYLMIIIFCLASRLRYHPHCFDHKR